MRTPMDELASEMRAAGVRRVAFPQHQSRYGICELELVEPVTIPAPPPFEVMSDEELSEPAKPSGTCIALGCMEPGGWNFDRRYCAPHGRQAAGIKS